MKLHLDEEHTFQLERTYTALGCKLIQPLLVNCSDENYMKFNVWIRRNSLLDDVDRILCVFWSVYCCLAAFCSVCGRLDPPHLVRNKYLLWKLLVLIIFI